MLSREIRVVLFDLDGTLLNTIPLIIESYVHTLRLALGREVDAEEIRPHLGKTLVEGLEYFCPGQGAEWCAVYRDHNLARHDQIVRPYPGVVELIRTLHGRGYLLGIVSSKARKTVYRGLDLAGLTSFFDVTVCNEDTPRHKPNPDPIRLALRDLHYRDREVLMVGDSPSDVRAARLAGVLGAGVLWGPFLRAELEAEKPDLLLRAPLDLLRWCPPIDPQERAREERHSG